MATGGGTRVGSFTARLGLDVSDYARGSLQADGYNQLLGRSFSTFVANPALGALNVIKDLGGGLVSFTKDLLESSEALDRQSKRTNVSVEAIQALKLEIERATGSADGFERSLDQLVSKLGEFRQTGEGQAKDALEALGFTPGDPRLADTERFLGLVIERLASLDDAQLRASLTADLFGQRYIVLSEVLANTGKTLDQLKNRPGIVNAETVAQLAAVNTQFGTLLQNIQGVATVAGANFLSAFFDEAIGDVAIDDIDDVARALQTQLIPVAKELGQEFGEAARQAREMLQALTELVDGPVGTLIKGGYFAQVGMVAPVFNAGEGPGGLGPREIAARYLARRGSDAAGRALEVEPK